MMRAGIIAASLLAIGTPLWLGARGRAAGLEGAPLALGVAGALLIGAAVVWRAAVRRTEPGCREKGQSKVIPDVIRDPASSSF